MLSLCSKFCEHFCLAMWPVQLTYTCDAARTLWLPLSTYKTYISGLFVFPRNLKSLIFFFLDTEGEKFPTFIAIKFSLKIHLGQYVSKTFLLQMLSMRSYAMCHFPNTSISYAESSGSLPSGWSPGDTPGSRRISALKQSKLLRERQ